MLPGADGESNRRGMRIANGDRESLDSYTRTLAWRPLMDVSGIFRGLGGSAIGSPGKKQPERELAAVPSTRSSTNLSAPASAEFRDVLSHYDVHNISPREFSELVTKLKETGAISESDYQELALVRLELDQQGLDPDGPLDLVKHLEERLQTEENELRKLETDQSQPIDRQQALRDTLRQIEWVQKFDLVNRAADYQPLDSFA
jgi:hypothetical protein